MAAGPDGRGNIAVVSKARGLNPALSVGQLLVNAGLQDGETVVHIFNSEDRAHAEAVAALALARRTAEPDPSDAVVTCARDALAHAVGTPASMARASFFTCLAAVGATPATWREFLGENTVPATLPPPESLVGKHVAGVPVLVDGAIVSSR